jgi:LytS/YehU family sensor histidine kinase
MRARAQSEQERAKKAIEEAQRMELQLLRSQLDPHFLFNSLNGISAEISAHPEAARQMVNELSDYLRYSLEQRHRLATPLSTELDAMSAYLKIEQARFGERLQTSITADPAARRKIVPSFLLQPMIENAVKHGFHHDLSCWELRIFASLEGDRLVIEVRHLGRLGSEIHDGVGLETLRRRLEIHYPGRHRFELAQNGDDIRARLELEGEPCFA